MRHRLPPAPAYRKWPRLRRWAVPVLGVVVLGLLAVAHPHKVDWGGAWQALRRYSPWVLAAFLALYGPSATRCTAAST